MYTKWVLDAKLAELGVSLKMNHRIVEMSGTKVVCRTDGKEVSYNADSVVCALGLKSRKSLVEDLRAKCKGVEIKIIPVGDVNKPRKIMQAVHEGFHAARRI